MSESFHCLAPKVIFEKRKKFEKRTTDKEADEIRDQEQAAPSAKQHRPKELATGTPNKRVVTTKVAKQQCCKGALVVRETKPVSKRVQRMVERGATNQGQVQGKTLEQLTNEYERVSYLINQKLEELTPKVEGQVSEEEFQRYCKQFVPCLNQAAQGMKSIAFDSLEQAVTAFGMVMRSFVKPFGLKMGKSYRGQTWYYDCVTTSHKKQDRESKVETRRVVGKHKSIKMNKG